MMIQEQLGQARQWPVLWLSPAEVRVGGDFGLLANAAIQVPAKIAEPESVLATYWKLLASAQPVLKLALLKAQKFTADGRQMRIAASLAALNAPQPTDLTQAQWKGILQEIEDED